MSYSHRFLKFALNHGALQFGRFKLKSGRVSPYFFNAGMLHSGVALRQLGMFYAQTIYAAGIEFDGIFGLAYKGIPIATATVIYLEQKFNVNICLSVHRKEVKDHGEGGCILGAPLNGQLVVVDDVITAGTAARGALSLIKQAGAQAVAIVTAFDRQERGAGQQSAVHEIEEIYCLRVISIANVTDLIRFIRDDPQYAAQLDVLREYRSQYAA